MVEIKVTEKDIADNLNGISLQKVIYEFLQNHKKYPQEVFIEELENFLNEEPTRRTVYSNEFVEYCISLFEDNDSFEANKDFNSLLERSNVFVKNEFAEIMSYTRNEFGYDYGYIQDQIWYALYPKYL